MSRQNEFDFLSLPSLFNSAVLKLLSLQKLNNGKVNSQDYNISIKQFNDILRPWVLEGYISNSLSANI